MLRTMHAPPEVTEHIFRLAVVPRVFFRLQLGEVGIGFQPLADHYLVVFVVGQFLTTNTTKQ